MLHGEIVGHNVGGNARKLFFAADLHETLEQFGAEALFLATVADQQREFSLVCAMLLAEPSDAKDFLSPGLFVRGFGDESNFTIVIVEANSSQAFVGDALR